MVSSLARVLALVLVTGSTAACAVASGGEGAASSADDTTSSTPATDDATSAAAAPTALHDEPAPTSPESLLADMAGSVLKSLLGHAVDGLFPSPTIDYDRLAKDFTNATHQAAVDQTVWTQKGIIQGKLDTLSDIEVRYQHSTRGRADALDAYQSIDSQWEDINASIETLNQPEIANATLGVWVSAAQIKMSMLGELVTLDPDRADGNKALLYANAKSFYAHLSSTKMTLLQTAMKNRVAQISPYCEEHYFSGSAGPRLVYSDGGKILEMFIDEDLCESHRAAYLGRTQTSFLAQETQDLQWMDDTLKAWQGIINLTESRIVNVTSATYGKNCNAPTDNALMLVGLACNTAENCVFPIAQSDLGDPAYGCKKDFEVTYTCTNAPGTKTVTVPAEASGQTVQLACL